MKAKLLNLGYFWGSIKRVQILGVVLCFLLFGLKTNANPIPPKYEDHNGVSWQNYFAHEVNTSEQLEAFLESELPFAKGNVRFANERDELVMATSTEQENTSILGFGVWFSRIMNSEQGIEDFGPNILGKGAKIAPTDETTADLTIAKIEELLASAEIPQNALRSRIVFLKVNAIQGPGGALPAITVAKIKQWRTRLPHLRISLGFTEDQSIAPYTRPMMNKMFRVAKEIGGPIDISLRGARVAQPDLSPAARRNNFFLLQWFASSLQASNSVSTFSVTYWKLPGDNPPSEDALSKYQRILETIEEQSKPRDYILDLPLDS